ncbi:flavodoxin family protein [Heliobacillus mobilis]|uniref:Flavodoxin family protein n=1 Tax=Heliobacterium mobile TaxID=28064 RepID=A0A6I3SNZ2_HELMO|nr:flavodoxin family protein [Heliobacterium mobile]MTV50760.1 flavodoxin family protein [Heliobacterium mobile]
MKKVLGIVVSKRQLGNSELLLKEIMDNVPEPCCKELIRLPDCRIEPCSGCYRCLKRGKECPIKDDFSFVLDKLTEADAVLFGVPVYFFGPHGSLKLLTDRMLGVQNIIEKTRQKPCIVVIPYGVNHWEGYAKTAALVLPRVLEMKLIDCWTVRAALPGECFDEAGHLRYARDLGKKLFVADEYEKEQSECPNCGSDLFRRCKDGGIECPLCGARQVSTLGQYKPVITHQNRLSTEALYHHFRHWLISMVERYIDERTRLSTVQRPYMNKAWWIRPSERTRDHFEE